MAKVNLNNIGSAYGSIGALNANFDAVEAGFDNTLSRDGTGPNQMEANLDMNNNDILNARNIYAEGVYIGGVPVLPGVGGGGDGGSFTAPIIDVNTYSPVGDGIADDTAALQAAINAAYGKILMLRKVTYRITAQLEITNSITIIGNGAIIDGSDIPAGLGLNQRRAIYVYGSTSGSEIPVTASLEQGDNTLVVNSTTFSKGDFVIVRNDEPMIPSYGNPASKKGYVSFVQSVPDAASLFLEAGAYVGMDHTQNLRVQRIEAVKGVYIENLEIQMGGVFSVHGGIRLDYCTDFEIKNVTIKSGEDHGIATWYCMNGVIDQCKVYDSTSAYTWNAAWNTGYAYVFYNASRNITLKNSAAYNCRRGNTGGNELPALYITVENNYAEGCDNAFGTHEPCFHFTIKNNYGIGVLENFIQVRGSNHIIQGNRVIGCGKQGVRVRTYYDDPVDGLHDIHIIDNHLEDCGETGIWIDGIDAVNDSPSDGGFVNSVVIRGGSIINAVYNAIYITRGNNVLIDGVLIDGQQLAAATDGNGVYINGGTDAWDRSSHVKILNSTFKNCLRGGVRGDYLSHLLVENCRFSDFVNNLTSTNAINVSYSDNVIFNNNTIDVSVGYYAYSIVSCDNITIDGGYIKGGSGLVSQDLVYIDNATGGTGSRNKNVKIKNLTLTGSNRYGVFPRYCDQLEISGCSTQDSGTFNVILCNDVTFTNNHLTATSGQIYSARIGDCERIILANNHFKPGSGGQAAGYIFRSTGTGKSATVNGNICGAFSTNGFIVDAMDHVVVTGNVMTEVVGTTKVAVTNEASSVVVANIPGNVSVLYEDVLGTTRDAVAGSGYKLKNANPTTVTLPASPLLGQEVYVMPANGRVDNIIARNGNNIMSLAEDMTIDNASAVVKLQYTDSTIGWRLV